MKKCVSILAVAIVLAFAGVANATNDNPPNPCGNHGNNCACEAPDGTEVNLDAVCTAVVNNNVVQFCAAYAEAEAIAKAYAICGDATSFCEGGDAYSMAVIKHSCEMSNSNLCNYFPPREPEGALKKCVSRTHQQQNGGYITRRKCTTTFSYDPPAQD